MKLSNKLIFILLLSLCLSIGYVYLKALFPSNSPQVDQYPAPATCPIAIMYQNEYYVFWGNYVSANSIEGAEYVGIVQSGVPETQMPSEDFQTNGEAFLNLSLWKQCDSLYIKLDEEDVYLEFEYYAAN